MSQGYFYLPIRAVGKQRGRENEGIYGENIAVIIETGAPEVPGVFGEGLNSAPPPCTEGRLSLPETLDAGSDLHQVIATMHNCADLMTVTRTRSEVEMHFWAQIMSLHSMIVDCARAFMSRY